MLKHVVHKNNQALQWVLFVWLFFCYYNAINSSECWWKSVKVVQCKLSLDYPSQCWPSTYSFFICLPLKCEGCRRKGVDFFSLAGGQLNIYKLTLPPLSLSV